MFKLFAASREAGSASQLAARPSHLQAVIKDAKSTAGAVAVRVLEGDDVGDDVGADHQSSLSAVCPLSNMISS